MKIAFNARYVRKDVYKTDKYDFVKFVVSYDGKNMYFNVNNNKYSDELYKVICDSEIAEDSPIRVTVDFVKDWKQNHWYCNLVSFAPISE